MKRLASLLVIAACLLVARGARATGNLPYTQAQCLALQPAGATVAPTAQCSEYVTRLAAAQADPQPSSPVYICDCQTGADANCVAGNDSTGTGSKAAPYQTWGKAATAFSSISAGSGVVFCQGGSLTVSSSTQWRNTNATSLSGVEIREYNPTGVWTPAVAGVPPIITLTGTGQSLFTVPGSGVANGYVTIENIDFEGPGDSGSNAILIGNGTHNFTIRGNVIHAFGIGINMGGTAAPSNCYTGSGQQGAGCLYNYNNSIFGNTIINNVSQGIFGTGDNLNQRGNVLYRNGGDSAFDHGQYVSGANITGTGNPNTIPSDSESIALNLYIDSASVATCSGAVWVMHGWHTNPTFTQNYIGFTGAVSVGAGCFGANPVSTGTGGEIELISGLQFTRNYFYGFGNVGLGIGTCVNCVVEDNIFHTTINNGGTSDDGILVSGGSCTTCSGSDNFTFANNTIINDTTDNQPVGIASGQGIGKMTIVNNEIYMAHGQTGTTVNGFKFANGSVTLKGAAVTSVVSTYTGTSNGGLNVTINGTLCQLTAINLSTATVMGDCSVAGCGSGTVGVAGLVSVAFAACVANTRVTYIGDFTGTGTGYFIVNGPLHTSGASTMTVASAPTGGGSPTAIQTLLGLDAGSGAAVQNTLVQNFNAASTKAGVTTFNWDNQVGSYANWSGRSFGDANSKTTLPTWVSTAAGGLAPLAPLFTSDRVSAGASGGPSTDYYGATWANQSKPDIGAIQRYVFPGWLQ